MGEGGGGREPGGARQRVRREPPAQRGFRFTEAHREQPGDWPDLDGVDLVLTLGSEWNVYRPETADLVAAEAAYVRSVVARQIPLLAICFGAQVLSHALGGAVSRTGPPRDRLVRTGARAGAPGVAAGPWMEWHDDVFTVRRRASTSSPTTPSGPQLVRRPPHRRHAVPPGGHRAMVRDWIEHGGAEQYRSTWRRSRRVPRHDPGQHRPQPPGRRGPHRLVPGARRGDLVRSLVTLAERPRARVWEGIHEAW